jgi:sirohydrochlorin ferrochelatase
VTAEPLLVLAAHGSADPRFDEIMQALAGIVRQRRPELEVRIGYLEHGPPALSAVITAGAVVVPVLLTNGYHAGVDIPAHAPDCVVTPPLGPEPRITTLLAQRLREAGWRGERPVVLAAAGSTDPQALADARRTAHDLGTELGLDVTVAFLSAGEPRLSDVEAAAVATYLLAPGYFADVVAASDATVVAAPLGADPRLAEIIIDRYDARRSVDE